MSDRTDNICQMSEETRARVAAAKARLAEVQGPIDEAKAALLDAIEQSLPDHFESLGRKYAHSQPEATKRLGAQGVKEFRTELRELGQSVAQDLRASTKIEWPAPTASVPRDTRIRIRNGFQQALKGPQYRLETLLTKHGFDIGRRDDYTNVSVWDVYDAGRHEAEAEAYMDAIAPLGSARRELDEALRADDAATVSDLWGDD